MFKTSRRGFLVGCSSAIAAMAGSQMNRVVFGNPEEEPNQNIMVVIFLRGGCDALSVIAPMGGDDRGYYEAARDSLQLPASGAGGLLQLGSSNLGLHHRAAHLHELFTDNKLAVIPATGMHSNTRSHFDAMQYMELGTPDSKSATSGWLTRHLQTSGTAWQDDLLPVLGVGDISPTSLAGTYNKVSMSSVNDFRLDRGFSPERDFQRSTLRSLYRAKNSVVHNSGLNAINATDIVELNSIGSYTAENGADYPSGSFGDQLKLVAQMIKLQLGLKVATVDLGGWDTHENQGHTNVSGPAGYFADRLGMLSQGMKAFYDDLNGAGPSNDFSKRTTVVCMSEFGRRLRENENRGTDHGHGGYMMVMGGETNGGLHGTWPGLHNDQLYDNADLAVTTDYRRVLSEIMIRRFQNNNLGTIFPGYSDYSPMNLVQGADMTPKYETEIITDPGNLDQKIFLPAVVNG
ncbi:MAG: hypothetical protein ACI9EW_000273 [Cellvibrionaceae bacterium]|jgi:uncharacterized protein (DUF1501 family)